MLVLSLRGQKSRKPSLIGLPLPFFLDVSKGFGVHPAFGPQVLAAKGKKVMRLSLAMLLRSKHLSAQNGIYSRLITATKRT